ncbi:GT-D fold domain-containing glycosyltransferase [Paenibacillus thalictri]|uniref:GT-D fold domain-containing protein n=1 Tax=Paenibacillus thalictri TaxID=2527873 RepID=UPI00197E8E91|nr:GT-D fold domain-containing glycosyltransferase [Paenibacillus thalictri]
MKRVAKRKLKRVGKKGALRKRKGKKTVVRKLKGRRKKKKLVKQEVPEQASQDPLAGHEEQFKKGYQEGFHAGHEEGHKKGVYDGGDAIVDTLLPFDAILPEISVHQIIEAGLNQLKDHYFMLQSTGQIAARIQDALDHKTPFSLIRLGDGEVLTLAQGVVLGVEQVRREGHFLEYAGVHVPDFTARDQVAEAVRQAHVVGIPKLRSANYQPLAFQSFRAHGIDYRGLSLTHSLINYYLFKDGHLGKLLRGRSVLVVGNVGPALAAVLSENGIRISGVISPVHGVGDVQRVMGEVRQHQFDIALVACGIAAVLISQKIAAEMGKVAIDFGHLADEIASRREPFR